MMKLNKDVIEKLGDRKLGYIERERYGRNNLVKITKSGEYVAQFSGELH